MEDKKRLEDFFERYATGHGTEQEHEAFLDWLATLSAADQAKVSRQYYKVFKTQKTAEVTKHPTLQDRIERSLDQLEAQGSQSVSAPFKISSLQIWSVAATILLLASIAIYFLFSPNQTSMEALERVALNVHKEKATVSGHTFIRLSDGDEIDLDELPIHKMVVRSNLQIIKTAKHEVVFKSLNTASSRDADLQDHVLITPKGRQYKITLPDGSKVWLNSASAFKFPSSFTAAERNVALSGEGYFEIAKDRTKPFIVETTKQRVEVLGTHFNVSAYADEHMTSTTLLEGSVRVLPRGSRKAVLLKPGQLAAISRGVQVRPADTNAAVAWKNGYFSFSGEKIQSIMRKLSRWYNVDVQYVGQPTQEDFVGTISQKEELSEILRMLELTGALHFKVDSLSSQGKERRIIVMP